MRESKDEVECHIIGVVEPRENAEVSYVSNVHNEACNGPQFEGSTGSGGRLGR